VERPTDESGATDRARARRLRLRRAPLVVAAFVVVAGLAYLGARETSVFALRTIDVEGASEPLVAQIRQALKPLTGRSLASLDSKDVVRRVESLPTVVTAEADRDFPHSLRLVVRPERAVAVLRRASDAWLVSARGRVMTPLEPGALVDLPRVWLGPNANLGAGAYLLPDEGGAAVEALARLPMDFPGRVAAARGTPDDLVLVLGTKTELRLGEAAELRLKLDVAATVLRDLSQSERRSLEYLDVSLPTRAVVLPRSQVEA
jgi:cell division protein FtsQ